MNGVILVQGTQVVFYHTRIIKEERRGDFVSPDSGAGQMSREEAKLLSRKGEDMAKAVGLFDNVPMSRLKRLRQWSIDRYERDQRAEKQYVYDEGMQKGMEKGHAEGKAEGTQTVALNMLKLGLELSLICKVTGLSVDEVHKLKDQS